MATTTVKSPTSRVLFGLARVDITPPIGIYHRMWGAARHHQASGIHRRMFADVMALAPADGSGNAMIRVNLDLVGLHPGWQEGIARSVSESARVALDDVVIAYSHTHAGGLFRPDRLPLPGGDLIPAYIEQLTARIAEASQTAVASLQPTVITYANGRCNLAANRDYWAETANGPVCGFNPDAAADDSVIVARVTDTAGQILATLVNYACHPTTLAWDNTRLSPDYVGAMREVVEAGIGAPCVFAQGACGDLGPRHGFVGDTDVADQNGRQLGYAALSALTALGNPLNDFHYRGPVISGATIGVWEYRPFDVGHLRASARFVGGAFTVNLPLRPQPERAALEAELADWEARQRDADTRGDAIAARDFGARAERARRWLGRLATLPEGESYPFPFSVYRLGDAIWITTGAEPYNLLQTELRQRFPTYTLLVSPLSGGAAAGYLLPQDRYGRGLYQEEAASLAPGCLEMLINAISAQIEKYI